MGDFANYNRIGRARLAATLALPLVLLLSAPAAADTFTPTRLDDPAPPNKCKPDDCSLREALRAANNKGGRDTVTLGEGTYELEIPNDGTFSPLESGSFDIFTPIELRGVGPSQTKIDANGIDNVVSHGCGVFPIGAAKIKGLTLRGGGTSEFNCSGGGIFTAGKALKLENVTIKGNEAEFGGGIRSFTEKLTIKNSTITQNNAGEGGGLGLRADDPQPLNSIRSSTISGNSALKGGGILADGFQFFPSYVAPILDIDNSTVAGNDASGQGGGILGDNNAIVVLDNTTVAYNKADSDNTGGGVGGGIHQFNGASFQLNDSVLALNTVGTSGSGPACDGDFSDGGSLVDTTGTNPNCDFVGLFQPTVTTVPLIGPLADNGGPTRTVKLLAGSPAIGLSFNCPNLDQRGKPRPDDCDAGAFERKGP